MWTPWTIGAAVAAVFFIVGMRAIWEGSWERLKCFGCIFVGAVVIWGLASLEGWVSQAPFGVGTTLSFFCGAAIIILGLVLAYYSLMMVFAPLKTLQES